MDFQPANLFIRGASPGQGFSFGQHFELNHPLTVYKYLNAAYHVGIIEQPLSAAEALVPPIYVTTHRYYTGIQALRALAIPGPLPTHVLEINLPPGEEVELQGPSWITPLDPSDVTALPAEHRDGNGTQFLVWTPLKADWIGRAIAL